MSQSNLDIAHSFVAKNKFLTVGDNILEYSLSSLVITLSQKLDQFAFYVN